jgi:hypothetical protein
MLRIAIDPETDKFALFLGKYDEFTGALNRFRNAEVEGSTPFRSTEETSALSRGNGPCFPGFFWFLANR